MVSMLCFSVLVNYPCGNRGNVWRREVDARRGVDGRNMRKAVKRWMEIQYPPEEDVNEPVQVLSEPEAFQYTSQAWLSNLLTLPRSEILFRIRSRLIWNGFVATFVTVSYHIHTFPTFSSNVHQLLGAALGLLLVFRTDAAYSRCWEGRKLISKLVESCRSIVRKCSLYLTEEKDAQTMQRLCVVFAYALRDHLNRRVSVFPFNQLLTDEEYNILQNDHYNRPLMVSTEVMDMSEKTCALGRDSHQERKIAGFEQNFCCSLNRMSHNFHHDPSLTDYQK